MESQGHTHWQSCGLSLAIRTKCSRGANSRMEEKRDDSLFPGAQEDMEKGSQASQESSSLCEFGPLRWHGQACISKNTVEPQGADTLNLALGSTEKSL